MKAVGPARNTKSSSTIARTTFRSLSRLMPLSSPMDTLTLKTRVSPANTAMSRPKPGSTSKSAAATAETMGTPTPSEVPTPPTSPKMKSTSMN